MQRKYEAMQVHGMMLSILCERFSQERATKIEADRGSEMGEEGPGFDNLACIDDSDTEDAGTEELVCTVCIDTLDDDFDMGGFTLSGSS